MIYVKYWLRSGLENYIFNRLDLFLRVKRTDFYQSHDTHRTFVSSEHHLMRVIILVILINPLALKFTIWYRLPVLWTSYWNYFFIRYFVVNKLLSFYNSLWINIIHKTITYIFMYTSTIKCRTCAFIFLWSYFLRKLSRVYFHAWFLKRQNTYYSKSFYYDKISIRHGHWFSY
jgi:hypothetical protein